MRKILITGIFICMSFMIKVNLYANKINTVKIEQARDFRKVKAKKKIFIETLIPMIDEIKNEMKKEKIYTEMLIAKKKNKEKLNSKENKFLNEMYDKYKVKNRTTNDLMLKMVVPPTSFVLGQAALESGWGRSKLAFEGNNLFGMRSFTNDSKIAVKVGKGQYYKRYNNIYDSVEEYMYTLARHRSYKNLRKAIRNGEDSTNLIKHLANYSEVKNIYAKRLATIIKKNNFQKYDK